MEKPFFHLRVQGHACGFPVHAFTLSPDGAGFKLDHTQEVVSGLLATGLDFGPDGALYFGDWIDGWNTKNEGRIWKLDVPGEAGSAIRKETQAHIQADFSSKNEEALGELLRYEDMRVRLKAQFQLAKRGEAGFQALLSAARQQDHQLARIHGLWGMGQFARKDPARREAFLPFLKDSDPEIRTQAAKLIGDFRYQEATGQLIPLLAHTSLRVRLHATEALGRLGQAIAVQPILEMLQENNDQDAWLRHAGMIALGRIGEDAPLIALKDNPSKALRVAAVVALRRMKSPGISAYLSDSDPFIVTEAARAINDDYSIPDALPQLANLLMNTPFTGEPLIRRAINANLRVGQAKNLDNLLRYASLSSAPDALRAEAIAALSTWAKPSVLDRVDGRYRGEVSRDPVPVTSAFSSIADDLFGDASSTVQKATAKAVARLEISEAGPELYSLLKKSRDAGVRRECLKALGALQSDLLGDALERGMADRTSEVRSTAVNLLPESRIPEARAVPLFEKVLATGDIPEQQAALTALGSFQGEAAVGAVGKALSLLVSGEAAPEIHLDIMEAVEAQAHAAHLETLQEYNSNKPENDPLSPYLEALAGGNPDKGHDIFYHHEAAQCVRCHTIFEYGGTAGPGLAGLGKRLSPVQILESLIEPSAAFAAGYGVSRVELKSGESIAGKVMRESADTLVLQIGKDGTREVPKNEVAKRINVPSSMFPMGSILTKSEIRNLIAYLKDL